MKRYLYDLLNLLLVFVFAFALFGIINKARSVEEPAETASATETVLSEEEREAREQAVRDTVITFHKISTDIFNAGGIPGLLNQFPAVKQLRHELFRNISYLELNELVLIFDMANVVFKEIEFEGAGRARVVTFEEWNYQYQRRENRKPVDRVRGMGQGFLYTLEKREEGWMVTRYAPLDVEHEVEDEFLF